MGRVLRLLILGLTVLPTLAVAQSDSLTSSAAAAAAARGQHEASQPVVQPSGSTEVTSGTAAPTAYSSTTDLSGYWEGTIAKSDNPMSLTLRIEKTANGYEGSFDCDALQIANAPLANIVFTRPHGRWLIRMPKIAAAFTGIVQGDFLSGSFRGRSGYGIFHFVRTAPRARSVALRDVTWKNGDVTLAGTLLLPSSPGPHRAVLFLQDAGNEARWVNRYLAQKFAERGIVALVYDKRGVGQSTGDWGHAYFGALADDAVGGIRLLQNVPGVDPHYVGIYGHGQGGALAPYVAEKAGDVEFVIATSANALEPETLERYGVETAMNLPTLSPTEQADAHAYAEAVVRYAYWRDNWDQLKGMMAAYKDRSWYFTPPPFNDPFWTFSYNIQGYRPTYHWEDVRARVFLAYGHYDSRVPVKESIDAITEAMQDGDAGRHAFRTWLCMECDHDFRMVAQPTDGGWPQYAPDFADRLIDFVMFDRRK